MLLQPFFFEICHEQLLFSAAGCTIQGHLPQTGFFVMALTDRNVQVDFNLKIVLRHGHFWKCIVSFPCLNNLTTFKLDSICIFLSVIAVLKKQQLCVRWPCSLRITLNILNSPIFVHFSQLLVSNIILEPYCKTEHCQLIINFKVADIWIFWVNYK